MPSVRILLAARDAALRSTVSELLVKEPDVMVVNICDTAAGLKQAGRKGGFDVVILHLDMDKAIEGWDGLMAQSPKPSIAISSPASEDLRDCFLKGGGVIVVDPTSLEELGMQVKLYSELKIVGRRGSRQAPPILKKATSSQEKEGKPQPQLDSKILKSRFRAVLIGASTGGPKAILSLLTGWRAKLPVPIVVVQHIVAGGFMDNLITWLGRDSATPVQLAEPHSILQPGVCYFAPDDHHLELKLGPEGLSTQFNNSKPRFGFRPSVDCLFESAARELGSECIAMLLTGMGRDGAQGLLRLRQAGAFTMTQDEESSLVYGMPREAMTLKAAEKQLNLDGLCQTTLRIFGQQSRLP